MSGLDELARLFTGSNAPAEGVEMVMSTATEGANEEDEVPAASQSRPSDASSGNGNTERVAEILSGVSTPVPVSNSASHNNNPDIAFEAKKGSQPVEARPPFNSQPSDRNGNSILLAPASTSASTTPNDSAHPLFSIDQLRVDGKFVDAEGNRPPGQYVRLSICSIAQLPQCKIGPALPSA